MNHFHREYTHVIYMYLHVMFVVLSLFVNFHGNLICCADAPVYTVNNSFTVQEGDQFAITLGLDAFPTPGPDNFTWFYNGQILPMMPGIMFGLDFIDIQVVTRLDSGTYRVVANNIAGSGEASFELIVQTPNGSMST